MKTFILALAASTALAFPALSQEVRMSLGSYNLNNLPFTVAHGLGYYEDEGLDVTVDNFASGGSSTLQALISGSTDIAVGFYDHTIQMQAQDKHIVAFVQLARNSGLVLAGGENSTFDPANPESIKGAKVGITSPGSSSDFFIRYYLQQHGMTADDISIIGVGSGAAAVAALKQGMIDLLVNYDPAATFIEAQGVGKILIDARSDEGAKQVYGGIYPTSVLYAKKEYVEENPEVIQKVVNATVRTLEWMDDHSAEEIVATLPPTFISGDKETYIQSVENAKAIFSKTGMFEAENMDTPLKVLKTFSESVAEAEINLDQTYTNQFVEAVPGDVIN